MAYSRRIFQVSGVASINLYIVALPWWAIEFRVSAYLSVDCIHLKKLAGEFGGTRCEFGCVKFLDSLMTGNRTTTFPLVQHLNRFQRTLALRGCRRRVCKAIKGPIGSHARI